MAKKKKKTAKPKASKKKKAPAAKAKAKSSAPKKTASKKPEKKPGPKQKAPKNSPSKASQPKLAAEAKAQKTYKGSIPITNPYKLFEEVWDSKNESFISAIQRMFQDYEVPGKTDKQKSENSAQIIDKIENSMRKEPIPSDLMEQLLERFSKERAHQITSIMSMKPRQSIRLNILKVDINGFAGSKAAQDLKVKRCGYSPFAFDVPNDINPIEHPTFQRALFELEDESSQMAAILVNARPGQRILDLTAREGDHTLSICGMMKNKGSLFVYDADPNRLKVVKERAARAGVENIRIVSDNQIGEVKSLDSVLVDAPCSGSGLLARQPELKWRFKKDDLSKIYRVQAALLREGARKLKLGGHLIYVTSSLNISENEAQIDNFMKNAHSSYRVVPAKEYIQDSVAPYLQNFFGLTLDQSVLDSFSSSEPYFTMFPDVHGTNGMFAAIIERTRISS